MILSITLISVCIICVVFGIVGYRFYQIRNGAVGIVSGMEGGFTQLYIEAHRLYRVSRRRVLAYSKLAFQYIFHILVRVLFHVQRGFDELYVWARNRFMRNAVKSKASVSFFWSHLKEYKTEIESEREEGIK